MQKMINIYSSNFDNIPFTCMIITSVTFYLLYTQNDINSDVGGLCMYIYFKHVHALP